MTMTIEAWGKGKAKLVWTFKGHGHGRLIMSVVSALDGKDAPVLLNGKDSGETMAISLVDKLHSLTVVKMKGKPFGTSKGTFSPDFNTLTVENDFSDRPPAATRRQDDRSLDAQVERTGDAPWRVC